MKKKIEVVAAIIIYEDLILCAQRDINRLEYISLKYEFPGGKIEKGETQKEALKRELIEELDIEPSINDSFLTVEHQYPDFDLTMHSFICNVETKNITLKEHINYKWLKKEALSLLDWAAADLPIVNKLMQHD